MLIASTGLRTLDLRGDAPADAAAWRSMCQRSPGLAGDADVAARIILDDVRRRGDEAICEATARFEGRTVTPAEFEIDAGAVAAALADAEAPVREALTVAAANIREFHETQRAAAVQASGSQRGGARLESRPTPLRRVAVYAPGGTAAYPSSVLMAAIPAKVAGVAEVILLTPRPSPVVLAAAAIAGVDRVFAIGGAQAIAAAALGTATVPRVDKIVGPGNAYVTAAKRQVFGLCDIDGIAGPSEVLILADEGADPGLVAADLLAQSENDREASAVVVTDAPAIAPAIAAEVHAQLEALPRRAIAGAAIADHGAIVVVPDRAAMIDRANEFAPEHLELLIAEPAAVVDLLVTAGAIFVGAWTPEAAGDYTAGPSHVLPTAWRGPLRLAPRGVGLHQVHQRAPPRRGRPPGPGPGDPDPRPGRGPRGPRPRGRAPLPTSAMNDDPTIDDEPPWAPHLRPSLRHLHAYAVPDAQVRARLRQPRVRRALAAGGDGRDRRADGRGRAVATRSDAAPPPGPPRRVPRLRAGSAILGNGSDEIISMLLTVLSGDAAAPSAVLLPSPTFVMYGLSARALGLRVVEVPLDPELELDPAAMRAALVEHAPALCFLARPNNPTSSLWDERLILELVAEFPATVFVIDEAYIAFAPGRSLWRGDRPRNYVHMGTLSKVGLAAIRVGYCVADPALAEAIERIRPPYNVPEPSAVIAEAILERFADVQASMIAATIAGRERLVAILARIPGARIFPAHANIVLARLDPPAAATRLCAALAERGVLIKDVSRQPGLAGCVRVSVGTAEELDLLEAALAGIMKMS
ncbi:MAG: histidinol dehydrogenase [Nannocystaceae bacterium]